MEQFKIIDRVENIDKLTTVCNGSFNTMQDEYPAELKFDPRVASEYLTRAILSDNHCLVVAYESDNPVGVMIAALLSYPFSAALRAHVSLVALLPGYRNGDFGKKMLDEVCVWALKKKAVEITAGDVGIDLKRNDNIFESENWVNRGYWYSRKL